MYDGAFWDHLSKEMLFNKLQSSFDFIFFKYSTVLPDKS